MCVPSAILCCLSERTRFQTENEEACTHCVSMVQCTTILLLALQMFLRQGMKLFAVENLLQGAMQFMEPIKDTMHD